MHAPRPRARPFLSFSFSPPFAPFHLSSLPPGLCPVCRRFPRIAFRGQFNRSCAAGCAKWSCVLGDKWDTSFLSIGHLLADEFIRSRARNPAEPADRIFAGTAKSRDWFARTIYMCTRAAVRPIATEILQGRARVTVAHEACSGWNCNGRGDVTTFGCMTSPTWPTLP